MDVDINAFEGNVCRLFYLYDSHVHINVNSIKSFYCDKQGILISSSMLYKKTNTTCFCSLSFRN